MRRKFIKLGKALKEEMNLTETKRFMSKLKPVRKGRWVCWEFQGYLDENGYGQFKWRGQAHWAHRLAFVSLKGEPLEEGNDVDHRCRNHACCRPRHLTQKTRGQNSKEGRAAQIKDSIPF